jgi:squalene-hopene/tetraprenyl-beta-curcumene cyclase
MGLLVGCLIAGVGLWAHAAEPRTFGPDPQQYREMVDRAIKYLALSQAQDGSVSSQIGIGPTALATLGLLRSGRGVDDPQVAKGLKYLQEYVQESGGIHAPGTRISIYETCVALICLQEANRHGEFDQVVKSAEQFVRNGQWDEQNDKTPADLEYGGVGYGGKSRPDLSNTAFMLDALKACGAEADEPAIQKAMVFVSRCQNLESEHNTTAFAAKINDGGFFYTPMMSTQDQKRQSPEGGLRSYGSMTYSGFKSMLYAGLAKDDPRVKAAASWISKFYSVKENPGMGDAGLFYYYHTFSKALSVLGANEIEDAHGVKHDWRKELAEELASRQQENGSWVNTNTQWMEGDPNLATAFALLSLNYCAPVTADAVEEGQ